MEEQAERTSESAADDLVFKALAEPHRRRLLDALRVTDGQSMGDLCAVLPGLTRFGVMKHLGVLGDAGLVVVHRQGRHKFHYLNPVPIQAIHERWISRYAEATLDAFTDLRHRINGASTPGASA